MYQFKWYDKEDLLLAIRLVFIIISIIFLIGSIYELGLCDKNIDINNIICIIENDNIIVFFEKNIEFIVTLSSIFIPLLIIPIDSLGKKYVFLPYVVTKKVNFFALIYFCFLTIIINSITEIFILIFNNSYLFIILIIYLLISSVVIIFLLAIVLYTLININNDNLKMTLFNQYFDSYKDFLQQKITHDDDILMITREESKNKDIFKYLKEHIREFTKENSFEEIVEDIIKICDETLNNKDYEKGKYNILKLLENKQINIRRVEIELEDVKSIHSLIIFYELKNIIIDKIEFNQMHEVYRWIHFYFIKAYDYDYSYFSIVLDLFEKILSLAETKDEYIDFFFQEYKKMKKIEFFYFYYLFIFYAKIYKLENRKGEFSKLFRKTFKDLILDEIKTSPSADWWGKFLKISHDNSDIPSIIWFINLKKDLEEEYQNNLIIPFDLVTHTLISYLNDYSNEEELLIYLRYIKDNDMLNKYFSKYDDESLAKATEFKEFKNKRSFNLYQEYIRENDYTFRTEHLFLFFLILLFSDNYKNYLNFKLSAKKINDKKNRNLYKYFKDFKEEKEFSITVTKDYDGKEKEEEKQFELGLRYYFEKYIQKIIYLGEYNNIGNNIYIIRTYLQK